MSFHRPIFVIVFTIVATQSCDELQNCGKEQSLPVLSIHANTHPAIITIVLNLIVITINRINHDTYITESTRD